jgi:hypothetical protein
MHLRPPPVGQIPDARREIHTVAGVRSIPPFGTRQPLSHIICLLTCREGSKRFDSTTGMDA